MMRKLLFVALLTTTPALAQEQVPLKPGPGQDAVQASCSICHTLNYIRMNSVFLTSDGWKAEVAKMREAYGAPLDDDTAATITRYLASEYGSPPKS